MFVKKDQSYIERMRGITSKIQFHFKFGKNGILPPETQKELFNSVIKRNSKTRENSKALIEYENRKKNELVNNVINRLEKAQNDGVKISLNSIVTSPGGKKTVIGDGEEEAQNRGGNISYVVVECGEIVILEPIGQEGNSTFVGKQTPDLETKIEQLGRNQVLIEDILYKIVHDKRAKLGDIEGLDGNPNKLLYDYDSNHLLTILEMAISYPEQLISALKEIKQNQKFSNLTTVQNYMPATSEIVKTKVQELIKKRKINGTEVVASGRNVERIDDEKIIDSDLEV